MYVLTWLSTDALVEHWFNRRYRAARRDIYLHRDAFGWYVRGRHGGADGTEVTHTFTTEAEARVMVDRLKAAVPREEDCTWHLMSSSRLG